VQKNFLTSLRKKLRFDAYAGIFAYWLCTTLALAALTEIEFQSHHPLSQYITALAAGLSVLSSTVTAFALNYARLSARSERQAREFYALFETARTINTLSSLEEILDYSCHQLRKIAKAELVFIAIQKNNEYFRIQSFCGKAHNYNILQQDIRTDRGITGEACSMRRPVYLTNLRDDPVAHIFANVSQIQSTLLVPIIYRHKVYGMAYFLSFSSNQEYSDSTVNLLDAVTNIIGIACDNLNLLQNLNQQVENLTDLMDVASAVQGSLKQNEILHAIVEKSYQRFSAYTCQINLVHKEENWLEIAAFKGFTPKTVGRVNSKRVYLYTSRCPVLQDEQARLFTSQDGCPCFHQHDGIKSYMCAPLKVGTEVFGVIHLTSLRENVFCADDVTFLSSFAQEAGLAVQRGRLYEELALQKAKIETIIKSIHDPLIVMDGNGHVLMANDAFIYYFGIIPWPESYSFAELMRLSPWEITIDSHDYQSLLSYIYQTRNSLTVTCTVRNPSGTFYNHITLTPILNTEQKVTGMVALFHDVSELQELLNRINQEKIHAEKANLLKTEFLANISHELRTPLNSIIGYTQCVLDGIDGPINTEQRQDLQKVLVNANNLLRLINDILDLSKLELERTEVFYERVKVKDVVDEALKTIKPMADARQLDVYANVPEPLEVITDSFRLQQIMVNLLSNAVKFTPEGFVKVTTDLEMIPGYVTFLVSDSGIGINPKAQEFIFDSFRQADGSITRKYGGTGLGLSICKNLVQLLGGNIWASSEPGVGSTFFFTIPQEDKRKDP